MLTEGMKERKAVGLAEMAWGRIVHWHRAGKIQGDLTYEEFRTAIEPLFREALELPVKTQPSHDSGKGKPKCR